MNQAFALALEARLTWMQVRSYGSLGFHRQAGLLATKTYRIVRRLAIQQARSVPHDSSLHGPACPALISDVPRLAEIYEYAWSDEHELIDDELNQEAQYLEWQREQALEKAQAEERRVFAQSCIERNDWDALKLPSPEHLSSELYAGKTMEVDQHSLVYEHDIVWMTNPYGVDGILGNHPTVELCREFLTTIGEGEMYGPEP
jgi:hypothetical protein